ncbi:MAG: ABC transporter substrate-binding protein [Betaproteobacteria bacterium HGW-Betaproteobacteria-6]|jgi:iron complex transport system substrate-binding protein|nr:MAG: ABC transporter substrate-binding protein [Betaproteobacteria bacterium HGW-Betaproteobacteria-6]
MKPKYRKIMDFRRIVLLCLALSAGLAQAADCPRIVSQSPYISRALDWLGLTECIVGVSRYDTLARPDTGGVIDPDAGLIDMLEPDLVVFSEWTPAATAQAATPSGAKALRVGGFRGMAGVEAMLRDIGRAAGVADIDRRVDTFAADWRAAARVDSRQRRVLILSACSNAPYSFGRGTTLHEVFSAAGFEVVTDHDSIRNFKPDTPDGDVAAWIGRRRPDLIFALQSRRGESCNPAIAKPGIPILPLTGEYFTHPGPELLKGLEELRQTLAAFGA